ncbi:MAG TPA: sigma-54 dependent transcriptional regulator [Kofleriaceae bacterium]|nr:sigma-54 dependent transcriptional regulator [Kofleriaceae bacterium]
MTERVLVVDDKLALAETLADGLCDRGYAATAVATGEAALSAVRAGRVDVLVTDLRMPDLDGLALLDATLAAAPELPVIVMTAYGAIDSAVDAIRKGAYHYLTKPFKVEELLVFVERAIAERALRRETAELRKTLGERFSLAGLVGRSPAMQSVLALVERVAASAVPVLLTGETGVGKGAVARAIHGESKRAGRFVAINCAALPDQLLESELFGHVRGAFTGATADRVGLFAEADGGTVLLDEIAEMSPALQAKLLHVLETGTVRPLGAAKERAVDARVIAATHRDLRRRIGEGTFREDLLYRLEVVAIEIPAVRARGDDVPLLVDHFLAEARQRHPSSPATAFSREALARLCDYRWPGNVREIAHVVERCVLLANASEIVESELPEHVRDAPPAGDATFTGPVIPVRELQRRYARWALDQLGGQKGRTAAELEVDVKTLNRWLADED